MHNTKARAPSAAKNDANRPCGRGLQRHTPRALAMALAATLVGAALLGTTAARAQSTALPSSATQSHQYAIPAGSLQDALDKLAAQTNVQIAYRPALVHGLTTRGLSGQYTTKDALRHLLVGTGLASKETGASTFVLIRATDPPPASSAPPSKKTRSTKPAATAPRTLNPITVSGSLINNAQIQTATPTYTTTIQQIQNKSFSDVADVIQSSMFNVGNVQGQAHSGSFTQGAQAYKLFGLEPGYTLLLIDGKPVTDFGQLYNGDDAFNSVSNIPLGIVSRIDVMPGGGSSIYGSSAIAGVINIVTRQHYNGAQVSVRTGTYTKGGGDSEKITAMFGHDFGNWNVMGTVGVYNQAPIWNFQRAPASGSNVSPDGLDNPFEVAYILDYGPAAHYNGHYHAYVSPPDGCAAMQGLFGGTTYESNDKADLNRTGTFCGSPKVDAMRTLSPSRRNYDTMLSAKYYPNDNLRLYANFMGSYQRERYTPGTSHWSTEDFPGGGVEDATTTHIEHIERYFAPEEMPGGYSGALRSYTENNLRYRIVLGANGNIADSDWAWDAYFMHDSDRNRQIKSLFLDSAVDQFFEDYVLGAPVGFDAKHGVNTYNINYKHEFTPLTPAQWASFVRPFSLPAKTWINNTRITLSNTDLFSLPGGGAGFAALLEGGNMAWYEATNPYYASGQVFGHSATSGGGRRQHKAAAMELNLPVFKQLTFDLSGRFDKYKNDVVSNDKFTYKIGIEFRPFSTLLVRGNYATAFQAPQMPALFLGPSQSFTDVTDYYQCEHANAPDCSVEQYNYEIETNHGGGNPTLRPTTAKTWTAGVVWAPTNHLSFHTDYLHVDITNEVVLQDTDHILMQEAQCRLGTLDSNSQLCQQTIGQVQRDQFGNITSMTRYYANLAAEDVNSLTAGMQYSFELPRLGHFRLQLDYNDLLKHTYQELPSSPFIDQLQDPENNAGIKSVATGSLTWDPDQRWSTTLYFHRIGNYPNEAARAHGYGHDGGTNLPPWVTYNWSLRYQPMPKLRFALQVRNLLNKYPPADETYTGYPYYDDEIYDILGREVMLTATWKISD